MRILHVFDHFLPLHSGYTFRSANIPREQCNQFWQTSHLTSLRDYSSPVRERRNWTN
jgi:glycogen(starch) synthase